MVLKMKKIILIGLALSACTMASAKSVVNENKSNAAASVPAKEDCEMNADILAYSQRISTVCGYEINKDHLKFYNEVNKSCVAKYGNSLVYNASMMGVHATNAEIQETGKASTCARAYSEYKVIFE